MRPPVRIPVFAITVLCWLAYGPGAVGLQATAACRHAQHHHATGSGHSPAPPQACFCDAMTGHGESAPTPIAHPDPPVPAIAVAAERASTLGEPPTIPSRAPRAPEPPPPIPA